MESCLPVVMMNSGVGLDAELKNHLFFVEAIEMKQSDRIAYEKPELSKYGFFGIVQGDDPATGGLSTGGDLDEGCDSDFDE